MADYVGIEIEGVGPWKRVSGVYSQRVYLGTGRGPTDEAALVDQDGWRVFLSNPRFEAIGASYYTIAEGDETGPAGMALADAALAAHVASLKAATIDGVATTTPPDLTAQALAHLEGLPVEALAAHAGRLTALARQADPSLRIAHVTRFAASPVTLEEDQETDRILSDYEEAHK